jgi:hypothetical protein
MVLLHNHFLNSILLWFQYIVIWDFEGSHKEISGKKNKISKVMVAKRTNHKHPLKIVVRLTSLTTPASI